MTDEITDAELEQRLAALLEAAGTREQTQQLQELVALLRQGALTPEQRARLETALRLADGNWPAPADTRYF